MTARSVLITVSGRIPADLRRGRSRPAAAACRLPRDGRRLRRRPARLRRAAACERSVGRIVEPARRPATRCSHGRASGAAASVRRRFHRRRAGRLAVRRVELARRSRPRHVMIGHRLSPRKKVARPSRSPSAAAHRHGRRVRQRRSSGFAVRTARLPARMRRAAPPSWSTRRSGSADQVTPRRNVR